FYHNKFILGGLSVSSPRIADERTVNLNNGICVRQYRILINAINPMYKHPDKRFPFGHLK
ncbi:hypothetical protein, partial [Barnesiella intestinihominis]|uniref:hypothetical protein n=1 Tax=Barnesiella intestinihominis TaxID=487174 RepID=UPI003AB7F0A1